MFKMTELLDTKWGDKTSRRLDILNAARQQLESVGYTGLNIRSVAQAAGISPGLVYSYFANKEELFATLYAQRLAAFKGEAEALCQTVQTTDDLLVALLRTYLPVYQTYGREYNLFSLLRKPDQFSLEIRDGLTQTAIGLMSMLYAHTQTLAAAEGIVLANLPQPTLVLPSFWIMLNGLANHYAGDRQHLYGHDQDSMARFMAQTFWQGLKSLALMPTEESPAPSPDVTHHEHLSELTL